MSASKPSGLNQYTKRWRETRAPSAIPDDELIEKLCKQGDEMADAMERLQRERDDYRDHIKGVGRNIEDMLASMTAFDGDALGEKG